MILAIKFRDKNYHRTYRQILEVLYNYYKNIYNLSLDKERVVYIMNELVWPSYALVDNCLTTKQNEGFKKHRIEYLKISESDVFINEEFTNLPKKELENGNFLYFDTDLNYFPDNENIFD